MGGVYGWNAEAASKLAFYNEGGSKASITTQWTGDANLKIWNRANINNWDLAWGSVTDGETAAEGDLVNSGANAFVCPEKACLLHAHHRHVKQEVLMEEARQPGATGVLTREHHRWIQRLESRRRHDSDGSPQLVSPPQVHRSD
ncbi:hypothetical protein [Hallella sp.]|uniref:hypothetical protein n=1 Tax=Hallella sp. TaxID=2980186 RepID=UPI002843398E|nr:hypothetical protein [Hallella sp.]MDR3844091.1 hypothetical protein [Hallella sp.]